MTWNRSLRVRLIVPISIILGFGFILVTVAYELGVGASMREIASPE